MAKKQNGKKKNAKKRIEKDGHNKKVQLMRKEKGRLVGGVFAGIASTYGVSTAKLRVGFLIMLILFAIMDGFRGALLLFGIYILSWLFIPIDEK